MKLWSRRRSAQVPVAPLCCACIVGKSREAPTVTVTMPVVSLDDISLNTTGEGNTLTIVLSDNNTTCNPGFISSILTECVRVHGAMSEFFDKFPDHKNVTFDETDGGLDKSHGSLGSAFNTKEKKETHSRRLRHVLWCLEWAAKTQAR